MKEKSLANVTENNQNELEVIYSTNNGQQPPLKSFFITMAVLIFVLLPIAIHIGSQQ